MKLYEQFLYETSARRMMDNVNREVVNKELKLKMECYSRYIQYKSPKELANYDLCMMRAELRSMRNGISLARENIKTCMDKECKKELRIYIDKLIDFVKHKARIYIRKKAILLV